MRSLAARLGANGRAKDAGLTLIEVMISAALGLLIVAMLGGLLIATQKGMGTAALADRNTRPAASVMAVFTRYFHAATPYPISTQTSPLPAFATATATDMTFYAYVNLKDTTATPVKVRFYVDGSANLIQQVWAANAPVNGYYTFSSTSTKTVLAGQVASPTSDGTPLFSYLNSGGDVVSDPAAFSSVSVNLELGSKTAGASGNAHLSSVIALLNVGQAGAVDNS